LDRVARVSRVGFGVTPKPSSLKVRDRQHARRVRYPEESRIVAM
jgi:hypothetical protein